MFGAGWGHGMLAASMIRMPASDIRQPASAIRTQRPHVLKASWASFDLWYSCSENKRCDSLN
jgi:hypothetical protein